MTNVADNRVPPLVRLANAAGAALSPLGLAPAQPDAQEVIDAVARRTGLDAEGSEYEAAFRSAMASAGEGTELTPFGRWGVRQVAWRMLDNRVRIADVLRRTPEIERIPIERPVFVVGWFRSGTTLLHRLLASARGARVPRAWELYFPVPGDGDPERDAARRRHRMERMLRIAHTAIPALRTMHRIEAESPEEATVLLDNEGAGIYFLHAFGAHAHGHFLARHDMDYAYRSLKRQLQLLSFSGGAGRWVLKCPFSMWKLDALFRAFPDATVVHTFRDPRESIGSVCSLSAILQQSFCRSVDLNAIGQFWSRFCLDGLQRSASMRADGSGRIFEVGYRELVAGTAGVLTRLGSALDLELPPPDPQRGGGGHGRHRYDLASFGLDGGELLARFGPHLPVT